MTFPRDIRHKPNKRKLPHQFTPVAKGNQEYLRFRINNYKHIVATKWYSLYNKIRYIIEAFWFPLADGKESEAILAMQYS